MVDLMEKGFAWLESMRHDYLSFEVEYLRDGVCGLVCASPGRGVFTVDDFGDYGEEALTQEYILNFEELKDARFYHPEVGDQIKDKGNVFEVLPLRRGGCFRFTDHYRTAVRVFCKLIEEARENE